MGCCCAKSPQLEPGGRNRRRTERDQVLINGDCQDSDEVHNTSSTAALTNKYILDTLVIIRSLVDNEQEPPVSLSMLHCIADQESGWLLVVRSMVRVVPLKDPLGPAVIALLLDECPLPRKETVVNLGRLLDLGGSSGLSDEDGGGGAGGGPPPSAGGCQDPLSHDGDCLDHLSPLGGCPDPLSQDRGCRDPRCERNRCVVLGCLAEKLAGPSAVALLTTRTLEYLVGHLSPSSPPCVSLFALVALEKFAQTAENKATIARRLQQSDDQHDSDSDSKSDSKLDLSSDEAKSDSKWELPRSPASTSEQAKRKKRRKRRDSSCSPPHRLLPLESLVDSSDLSCRQVGFVSRWCLDNVFPCPGRPYSFERTSTAHLNAILNAADATEYLKVSPDGLEARCDAASFESVRCTFAVSAGVWFCEATLVTAGVMQIGWAAKESKFLNHEGFGIGDDAFSIAYDGCRQLLWQNAKSVPQCHPRWREGDVLGLLIDVEGKRVLFYLNGRDPVQPEHVSIFDQGTSCYFAAASFMSFQQCRFNFGARPFAFPPSGVQFRAFNDEGTLGEEHKVILPRHIRLQHLRALSVDESSCMLCFDHKAAVTLHPCKHKGFCERCSLILETCPMCRSGIEERRKEEEEGEEGEGEEKRERAGDNERTNGREDT